MAPRRSRKARPVQIGPWKAAALALQFGFVVSGFLLGGVWLGRYLDTQLGTTPWLVLGGTVFGLACSFVLLYQLFKLQV
jgi:ATP synthase protein I